MSDPSPSGETARWFCTMPRNLGRCFGPNTAPGHHACGPTWDCPTCDGEGCEEGCGRRGGCDDAYSGPDSHKTCRSCRGWGRTETEPPPPVPSTDTPSDEAGCPSKDCTRGECIDCPPPTPVDGDSGRRGKAQIMATALHDAGVNTTVSASDNGLLIRVHDRHTPRLLELLAPPPVGEERRPVDVTALPEWAAFVKRHQHHVRLGLGQRGECADCSLIEAVAAADRGLDDLRVELAVTQAALHQACHDGWSDAHGAMAGYLRDARAAAADRGDRA